MLPADPDRAGHGAAPAIFPIGNRLHSSLAENSRFRSFAQAPTRSRQWGQPAESGCNPPCLPECRRETVRPRADADKKCGGSSARLPAETVPASDFHAARIPARCPCRYPLPSTLFSPRSRIPERSCVPVRHTPFPEASPALKAARQFVYQRS